MIEQLSYMDALRRIVELEAENMRLKELLSILAQIRDYNARCYHDLEAKAMRLQEEKDKARRWARKFKWLYVQLKEQSNE